MLAIFNKSLVNPPQELDSPASLSSPRKPKVPEEILEEFVSANPSDTFSVNFPVGAAFAYRRTGQADPVECQRSFCGTNDIYCIFLGRLDNLSSLNRQYGLTKGDEGMLIIEAYRTLRDRGPYPAHEVLQDLEGEFGFVIFDTKTRHVFFSLGANEELSLFWGIAADGSVVISDNMQIVKGSCAKSYAQFPAGSMFHSERGLKSFEHPKKKMKAIPRIDSEGAMCGADFNVDANSMSTTAMPRVGSAANWALGDSQA